MFVDFHSHVLPSGDDGVDGLAEGRALCVEAARRGTAILYATPHVWPHLPLTGDREEAIRRAHAELRGVSGLELRLGFELTPSRLLLEEDPRRYELEGTRAVLVEAPFHGALDELAAVAEHIEAAGLRPVVAHPERSEAVLGDPPAAAALAERGWLLQVNGTSLLGRHGPSVARAAWTLIENGTASLVASDGHRRSRPPYLDEAYAATRARLGERSRALFDGSALGFAQLGGRASPRPLPSRAAWRDA